MSLPESQNREYYRADLDGLRAIAILAVIGFHYFPSAFRAGFIGVDIFFVLSGFLITSIILRASSMGTFSFLNFYQRRINRIMPALFTVLIAVIASQLIVLLPSELNNFQSQVNGGSFFYYNLMMLPEKGYFETGSDENILLHLWSLGIEEQFYLIWPLMLFFIMKNPRRSVHITLILCIFSFCLNVILIRKQANFVFYFPLTRIWELLAGGLVAMSLMKGYEFIRWIQYRPNISANAGLILLIIALAMITPKTAFPGWAALLPILGAILLILAGPGSWVNQYILANRFVVFIGLISYPLYLWHWPILVWFKQLSLRQDLSVDHTLIQITSIGLTLLLATITYLFIERKFRNYTKTLLICGTFGVTSLCAAGIALSRYEHGINGSTQFLDYFDLYKQDSQYRRDLSFNYGLDCSFTGTDDSVKANLGPNCLRTSGSAKRKILIWGDSHVQHLRPGLIATLPDFDILQITSGSCHPHWIKITEATFQDRACNKANELASDIIRKTKPDIVLISQALDYDSALWLQLAEKVRNIGASNVLFVGPVPRWKGGLPEIIARNYWPQIPMKMKKHLQKDFFGIDEELTATLTGKKHIYYVSAIHAFCDKATGCLARINAEKLSIVSHDSGHLTPVASVFLANKALAPIIKSIQKQDL